MRVNTLRAISTPTTSSMTPAQKYGHWPAGAAGPEGPPRRCALAWHRNNSPKITRNTLRTPGAWGLRRASRLGWDWSWRSSPVGSVGRAALPGGFTGDGPGSPGVRAGLEFRGEIQAFDDVATPVGSIVGLSAHQSVDVCGEQLAQHVGLSGAEWW